MKQLVFLVLSLISLNALSTSVTVSDTVTGTWTADTVIVEDDLIIPENGQLVIMPGTVVRFKSYYRIDVQGSLLAQGVQGDTILFTVPDTTNFYLQDRGRGGWSGIRFRQTASTQDSSLFEFCRFEFGKATEDSVNCYGGALFSEDFNKIRFSNCLFYTNYSFYSGGAVYLRNSDALVTNCVFKNNYSGNTGTIYGYGGGVCSMYSAPVIKHNSFYGNTSTGVGGAVSFDNSDPLFEHNIMKYNLSGLGGALGVLRSAPVRTFSNNLVAENEAVFFGGGICCIRSFPVFSNLTIADNNSVYGGGFYCNDSAVPRMYNSIIWGNSGFGPSVYIWDVRSAPSFLYCNIEGDTSAFEGSGSHLGYHGEYLDNINTDPLFAYAGMYDYQLWAESPCIDRGIPDPAFLSLPPTDLAGAPRVLNNVIDMGAYEYDGTTPASHLLKEIVQAYPNPFSEEITIKTPVSGNNTVVYIADITGRRINELRYYNDSFIWDGNDYKGKPVVQGLYFITLKSGDASYCIKVIKK